MSLCLQPLKFDQSSRTVLRVLQVLSSQHSEFCKSVLTTHKVLQVYPHNPQSLANLDFQPTKSCKFGLATHKVLQIWALNPQRLANLDFQPTTSCKSGLPTHSVLQIWTPNPHLCLANLDLNPLKFSKSVLTTSKSCKSILTALKIL